MGQEELLQTHLYILNNTNVVQLYLTTHKNIVNENNLGMKEKLLLKEHRRLSQIGLQKKS